jgi:WS/DGAT/MGAT family acyltransferase
MSTVDCDVDDGRTRVGVAVDRMAIALAREGTMWPRLCAAVIVARAVLQLDHDGFARCVGLDASRLRVLESGGCAPLLAPLVLPDLVPTIDWRSTGLAIPREPRHPAAARHPSAHRGPVHARPPPEATTMEPPMADELRFEQRMSDADALMWTIEKDPLLRSTITAVAILDQSPDDERLRASIERSLRLVPRLRQRVVGNPMSIAPPRWEFDPNFDVDYHLRRVRVAGAGTHRDLLSLAEPIAMQGFDRARPLWEFTVVDGLADGRAALIMKVHHAITDGIGAIKIALHLFDLERDAVPVDLGGTPLVEAGPPLNQMQRFVDALRHEQRRQMGIGRRSVSTASSALRAASIDPPGSARRASETAASIARMLAPATRPLSPLMTGRSLSVRFDTLTVPLDEFKAAARSVDGKLNDAFVAAVAGGLRRYHDAHGANVDALRMTMPINVRNDATADLAGNQFAPARFPVPMSIDDPVARMAIVRELVRQQRAEPALALTEPLAGVLYRLGTSLSTALFGSMLKGVDFITSNVPGVPVPVYLAGARMEAQYAFGPMTGAATNILLVSYLDELQIGVNTDPAAVPDPDVFIACLREGIDEIRKCA